MRHIHSALACEAVMKLSHRRRPKGIKVKFPSGMGRERVVRGEKTWKQEIFQGKRYNIFKRIIRLWQADKPLIFRQNTNLVLNYALHSCYNYEWELQSRTAWIPVQAVIFNSWMVLASCSACFHCSSVKQENNSHPFPELL